LFLKKQTKTEAEIAATTKLIAHVSLNNMLSHRWETALQGAL